MGKEEDLIDAVLRRAQEVNGTVPPFCGVSCNKLQNGNPTRKLVCAEAFELAQEFEAEIVEIGRICNRYNIKICECQLGCFG
ncbi:hypothetical protein ACFL1G_01150 [Planctomycetota bacterium]